MAIATSLSGLITKISLNPDVLVVGLAIGYLGHWYQTRRKRRQGGMGGMGMGM